MLNKVFFIFVSTAMLSACTSLQTRNSLPKGPQQTEGAVLVDKGQEQVPHNETAEIETTDKLAIIFGPGGAKTYAQAGFIKELTRAEIPVSKIVGLEWGSLISALYASKAQAHEVEWQLFKMETLENAKEKSFLSLLRKEPDPQKVWEDFFEATFAGQQINNMTIPWSCAYDYQGIVRFASSGPIVNALKKCFFFPPNAKESRSLAAPDALLQTVNQLKKEGYGPIVYVDVLSGMVNRFKSSYVTVEDKFLWSIIQRSLESQINLLDIEHVVIKTGSFMDDFDAKNIMIKKGEGEASAFIKEITEKYKL